MYILGMYIHCEKALALYEALITLPHLLLHFSELLKYWQRDLIFSISLVRYGDLRLDQGWKKLHFLPGILGNIGMSHRM